MSSYLINNRGYQDSVIKEFVLIIMVGEGFVVAAVVEVQPDIFWLLLTDLVEQNVIAISNDILCLIELLWKQFRIS